MTDTKTINKKRPFGFYVCSIAFSFERMSFYSVKWLLAYFLVKSVAEGGLGLEVSTATTFQSTFVAATYIAPVLLAPLADRFVGARYCVAVGLALMGVGYIMAGFATSMFLIWVMLFLVSVGTGLFKGNLTAMIGRLFYNQEELDSAFSTYYSFVNVGSFIGTTIVAFLVGAVGYKSTLMIYGVITLLGLVWYLFGIRYLGEAGKKPFKIDERKNEEEQEEVAPLTTLEKKRVIVICVVSAFSIVFWLFWYLAYLPVYYHWDGAGAANWMIGSFTVPSAWFDSLNAFGCMALGPLLGSLWTKLAARPQGDMSLFRKTGIGLLLLGSSYVIFAVMEATRGEGQANLLWLVLMGSLLTLGEMFFSPLGNSFVSKYAPAKILSTMMSVWIVAAFFASLSFGWVYNLAFFKDSEGLIAKVGSDFVNANIAIAVIAAVTALIVFIVDKPFVKMLEEE